MMTKCCPHCGCVLTNRKVLILGGRNPTMCDECGGLIKSTHTRDLLAAILPIVITVALVLTVKPFRRYPEVTFVLLLVLFPFAQAILAKPVKVEIVESPCERCKRIDVGYRRRRDTICDECLTREEEG